jgi:DNA modification methylase
MTFKIIPTPKTIIIKRNPKYENIVPKPSEEDFDRLVENIKEKDELIQPIVVDEDGNCLDGNSRVRACEKLGKPIPYDKIETRQYDSELDKLEDIWILNSVRRHYDEYQRYLAACEIKKIEEQKARQRQSEAGKKHITNLKQFSDNATGLLSNDSKPVNIENKKDKDKNKYTAAAVAADKVGLSPKKFYRYDYVHKHGKPEEIQKLKERKSTVNREYGHIRAEEIRQRKREQAAKSPTIDLSNDGVDLILGDFIEKCKQIPDNSIDLIFTDPPYKIEDDCLRLYKELGITANRVLKPGCSLVVYTPQIYLDVILENTKSVGLKYWWPIAVKYEAGHEPEYHKHVFTKWKPLLWFIKGDKLADGTQWIPDVIESGRPNKDLHEWGQNPIDALHVISKLTVENQIILDPMLGSGVTALSCIALGRKCIGVEIEESRFNVAKGNILEFSEYLRQLGPQENKYSNIEKFMEIADCRKEASK